MRIDYDNARYECDNYNEYYAVLAGIDPFAYAMPVWSAGFQSLMAGWTQEDADRFYSSEYPREATLWR